MVIVGILTGCSINHKSNQVEINPSEIEVEAMEWQDVIHFPNCYGYLDDTLAMNSIYGFNAYKDQGKMYLSIGLEVEDFQLFIDNHQIDTGNMQAGPGIMAFRPADIRLGMKAGQIHW